MDLQVSEHHHEDDEKQQLARTSEYPPLAWDRKARRFKTRGAAHWRVLRKQGGRGRPELVPTDHGPLHIEIDSTYEDLAALAGPGSYVLQAVDGDGLLLPDVPTAHIEVIPTSEQREGNLANGAIQMLLMQNERLLGSVERLVSHNVEREKTMVDAMVALAGRTYEGIHAVQGSSAELIRAAQRGYDIAAGVSLPRTPPPPQLPPATEQPPRSLVDFLCSPAGASLLNTVSAMVRKKP